MHISFSHFTQEELEEERRSKAGMQTRCKKLEQDLADAQRVAEEVEKLRDEASKSAKKAHQVRSPCTCVLLVCLRHCLLPALRVAVSA